MSQGNSEGNSINSEEFSFKEIVFKFKSGIAYLTTKWVTILLISLLGGALGLAYSFVKKPLYAAKSTFVLEEGGKAGGLGQYAGLASLAGIDIGSAGGGGIFQGDNILELYKSRLMIEKVLLSSAMFNGKQQLLIDRYVDFTKMREKWKKDKDIGDIQFFGNPENFNRKQDSIITKVVEIFNEKNLSVSRPDKKITIINVNFTSEDELFSKEFVIKMVKIVNDFYVQTKTKKSAVNVNVLQHQADSVRTVLNSSISGVASALDAAPNANPALLSLRVPSQRRQIDVQSSSAIYTEIVKNLEIGKITLRQEMPLIQVIDQPVLPLTKTKVGKIAATAVGIFLGAFIGVLFVALKKIANNVMS